MRRRRAPCHGGNDMDTLIHGKSSNVHGSIRRPRRGSSAVPDVDDHPPRTLNVAWAIKGHICRAEATQQVTPITPIVGEGQPDSLTALKKIVRSLHLENHIPSLDTINLKIGLA